MRCKHMGPFFFKEKKKCRFADECDKSERVPGLSFQLLRNFDELQWLKKRTDQDWVVVLE